MSFNRRNLLKALALSPLCTSGWAFASEAKRAFPTKQVKFVVPLAPGSSGDLWTRMVAPRLEEMWGQSVVVENKPGASGTIGASYVARSAPDGHTVLVGSQTTAFAKMFMPDVVNIDPLTELVPVAKFLNYEQLIVTNAKTFEQAKILAELAELSRTRPGGLNFGSIGDTSQQSVKNVLIAEGLNMEFTPVNYPGIGQFVLALMRDDVQYIIATPAAAKDHIQSGALVPLCTLGDQRFAGLPEVPSLREAGYQGYIPGTWGGIFAPAGTPENNLVQMAADLATAAGGIKEQIQSSLTAVIPNSGPATFREELEVERKALEDMLKRRG